MNRRVSTSKGRFLSISASKTRSTRGLFPAPFTSLADTWRCESKRPFATVTRLSIVYCAGGVRSIFGAEALSELGYRDVASMAGGFSGWKASGLPWRLPQSLTPDQRRRYSRHLLIPEVGEEGQRKLLDAKVLLVGAGGLGSPAALYLAAAGVGTLGIVDADIVDDSNLQRQVVHTTERVGMPKVESARVAIEALNPDVQCGDA